MRTDSGYLSKVSSNFLYMKNDQHFWNFFFSLIFVGLVAGGLFLLWKEWKLPVAIEVFDFFLVVLASFRLTRLFVYDKITQFVRDFFMETSVVDGVEVRGKYARGPLRTLSDLLDCPWCTGVWVALPVLFFYFYTPFAWFPILLLAVTGLATFIQISSNAIGWTAENLKNAATKK